MPEEGPEGLVHRVNQPADGSADMAGNATPGNESDSRDSGQETPKANDEDNADGKIKGSMLGLVLKCMLCIAVGFVFGFVVEKCRVFEPSNIQGQMMFKKLIYLKVIMSALAAGMFVMAFLAMLPATHSQFQHVCNQFYARLADKGVVACAAGGLIMGIGVALAGACPEMVWAQLGAQMPNAAYTLVGAMAGSLVYGLLKSKFDGFTRPVFTSSTNPWAESSYFITVFPLVAMFGMLVFAFDIFIPWTAEVKVKGSSRSEVNWIVGVMTQKVWPPYVAGIIIGLLQCPLVLGAGQSLGGSTVFTTVVAQVFVGPLRKVSPYLNRVRGGFNRWWQVFFVAGIMCGAYSSAALSKTVAAKVGVEVSHALLGGALMSFGAQVSGGGISLHGLTGMGLLSILSCITMVFVFLGGGTTAIILRQLGLIKYRA